jgi:hypothetical protein
MYSVPMIIVLKVSEGKSPREKLLHWNHCLQVDNYDDNDDDNRPILIDWLIDWLVFNANFSNISATFMYIMVSVHTNYNNTTTNKR